MTNYEIKIEAEEAARGAWERAKNRGWDEVECARCYGEAYQAVLADYPEE